MEGQAPHVLVVDDDQEIRDLLGKFLVRHDCRVTTAADGKEMARALADWRIDLVVLDLMLPGDDGLVLCRRLRAESDVPVIMLTAMREDIDRIVGLEIGADDYLAKPFNPRELLARIRAVLRRTRTSGRRPAPVADGRLLRFAGYRLDLSARRFLTPDGHEVDLTAGEFDLLVAFAERPGRVLNRDQLLDLTRGRDAAPFERSIDSQVSRLRRKIENDASRPTLIKTVRSGGYVFTPRVERE
jgi:two-component system OmpR family response regulator